MMTQSLIDGLIDEILLALLSATYASLRAVTVGLGATTDGVEAAPDEEKWSLAWYVPEDTPWVRQQIDSFARDKLVAQKDSANPHAVEVGFLRSSRRATLGGPLAMGSCIALAGSPIDGTLGAFVSDTKSEKRYLITSRHVIDGYEGDLVVCRDPSGQDEPIARLSRCSKWMLGDRPAKPNTSDVALAEMLSGVATAAELPSELGRLAPKPRQTIPSKATLIPVCYPNLEGTFTDQRARVLVEFPTGEYWLSDMCVLRSKDKSTRLADFGDSGCLFVFRDGEETVPAGFATALGMRPNGEPSNAVVICPAYNALAEFPDLELCFL